jgi:hypothetical protein
MNIKEVLLLFIILNNNNNEFRNIFCSNEVKIYIRSEGLSHFSDYCMKSFQSQSVI